MFSQRAPPKRTINTCNTIFPLSTPTGKDYTCRTKENEKPKATDMVVGSDITYEINGNKGKVKLANGKDLDCTVVRVANTPVATPPPADAPGATKPNP